MIFAPLNTCRSQKHKIMITPELEKALIGICDQRNELSKSSYSDPKYDDLEDQLHDMEDDFLEEYGPQLEEILMDVHDEYAPDIDVLSPLSYIAKNYQVTGSNDLGNEYEVTNDQGVFVEIDDYLGKPTKFVIVPNPFRIILNIDRNNREVIWKKETSAV